MSYVCIYTCMCVWDIRVCDIVHCQSRNSIEDTKLRLFTYCISNISHIVHESYICEHMAHTCLWRPLKQSLRTYIYIYIWTLREREECAEPVLRRVSTRSDSGGYQFWGKRVTVLMEQGINWGVWAMRASSEGGGTSSEGCGYWVPVLRAVGNNSLSLSLSRSRSRSLSLFIYLCFSFFLSLCPSLHINM